MKPPPRPMTPAHEGLWYAAQQVLDDNWMGQPLNGKTKAAAAAVKSAEGLRK